MKKLSFVLACVLFLGFTSVFAQNTYPDKKAEALMKQHKFADALPFIEEMIKLEPKNFKWQFDKGVCELRTKKFEQAKLTFAKVQEMNKEYTPAYLQAAQACLKLKQYDLAIEQYNKASLVEKVPAKKGQYKLMTVDALLQKGDVPKAKVIITELEKTAPENFKVLYYSGDIKLKEKNWSGAKETYSKILTLEKFKAMKPEQQVAYYYNLGLAYIELGDEANARTYWQKANYGQYADKIAERKPEWVVEFNERPELGATETGEMPANTGLPSTPASNSKPRPSSSSSSGGDIDWGF